MINLTSEKGCALVTGATGYVGSHLVNGLLGEGWFVHVVTRPSSNLAPLLKFGNRICIHEHDGTTFGMISLMRSASPDIVFHLASTVVGEHKPEYVDQLIESNVLFSTQLLEAMAIIGVQRLVNTGTFWQYSSVCGGAVNLYAATKQAFEDVIVYYSEDRGIKALTLVLFDTYGPNDPRAKLIPGLWQSALSGKELEMSPGGQLIDIVYIDDVVAAFLRSPDVIESQVVGCLSYGVSSGVPIGLRELVAIFEKVSGEQIKVKWGARPYRKREVMVPWSGYEILPGWTPKFSLEEGILLSRPSMAAR